MEAENDPVIKSGADQRVDLIHRVAQLTRHLRESMRELGLDRTIKDAAQAIPDARDRLHYVARMTEQAANRVLNAAEQIQPLQESMQHDAAAIDARWQAWSDQTAQPEPPHDLIDDTRILLQTVCDKTQASEDRLMEIIMAQDFQDLTGQVITKMLHMVARIETELVQVLVDNAPHDKEKTEEAQALLNGPQVSLQAKADVVTGQDQVDDLLANLGF